LLGLAVCTSDILVFEKDLVLVLVLVLVTKISLVCTEYSRVRSCLEAAGGLKPDCSRVYPQTMPAALLKPTQNTTTTTTTTSYVEPGVEMRTIRDYIYSSFTRHLYATTTLYYAFCFCENFLPKRVTHATAVHHVEKFDEVIHTDPKVVH